MAKKPKMPLMWVGDSHTLDRPDPELVAHVVHGHQPPDTTKTKRGKKRKVKKQSKSDAA